MVSETLTVIIPLSQVQSCHGLTARHGLLRLDDSSPWGQITESIRIELHFNCGARTHAHRHTHNTPDPAQCLNVSIKRLFVPIILFLYLLFLVFFVLLSQQRFWSVSGTKLIKFQWVPYTPEGVCVGKAWCSAWPHSRFQSQTCPESAGRQAFWWGLEVKVNMLFFSEWSHSPQKQLRCLLLQEALMSFTPVWITYVAATSTPSPKQFFLLL